MLYIIVGVYVKKILLFVFFTLLTSLIYSDDACLLCEYDKGFDTKPDYFEVLDKDSYTLTTHMFIEKINETTGLTDRFELRNLPYIYRIIIKEKYSTSDTTSPPITWFCKAHTNASGVGVLHLDHGGGSQQDLNNTNKTYSITAIYHPLFEPIPGCSDETSYIYNVTGGAYVSIDDLPYCNGFSGPLGTINSTMKHSADSVDWTPPSPLNANVPAVCIPILIFGGMFLGFLFSAGRNPFLAFNFFSRVRASRTQNYYMRNKHNSIDVSAGLSAVSKGLSKAGLKTKDGKDFLSGAKSWVTKKVRKTIGLDKKKKATGKQISAPSLGGFLLGNLVKLVGKGMNKLGIKKKNKTGGNASKKGRGMINLSNLTLYKKPSKAVGQSSHKSNSKTSLNWKQGVASISTKGKVGASIIPSSPSRSKKSAKPKGKVLSSLWSGLKTVVGVLVIANELLNSGPVGFGKSE